MRTILVAAILLGATCPAAAIDSKGVYGVRGSGTSSCGTWVQEHRSSSLTSLLEDAWLLGYVTAYNYWTLKGSTDVVGETDAPGMVAAMTQYCENHPLDSISAAAVDLIIQLRLKLRSK